MSTKRKHPVKNDEATSSKAQKLENDWSMGLFDHLCEELKEMVFDYLPGKDLINLASCNKALNEYIGSKSRYMKKIAFTIKKLKKVWKTPRKYENLIFNEIMSERDLRQIGRWLVYDGSENIKSIVFNCTLTADLFCNLILSKNMESLKIEKFSNSETSVTLNMPSLKSLVIMCANKNMKTFANCKLKNLEIHKFSTSSRDSFEELIENQTELERFHLGVADWFFEDTLLFDAPFKLTELSLTYQKFDDDDKTKDNFLLFINKHQETLKTVRCTHIDTLNYFSNFENLQNIELVKYHGKSVAYYMKSTARFDQAQKLELKCGKTTDCYLPCFKNLSGIENKFPKLQELSIQHGKMIEVEIFSTLTNLKKLSLIDTEIAANLIIPTVEDLTFIKCVFPPMKMPYDFSASSVQKLKVHQCTGLEWVHAYLKHPGTNLATFDASPAGEFEEFARDDRIKTFVRN